MSKDTNMKKKTLKKTSNSKAPVEAKKDDKVISIKTDEDGKKEVCIDQDKVVSIFGIENESLVKQLVMQAINASSINFVQQDGQQDKLILESTLSMIESISPQNGLEAMLAVQMVTVHNMSLDMSRRAMLKEQTYEGVSENINRATKLMRTFTAQMEALKRLRMGGKQTIQVQHVHVNEGGQAIVGDVKGGGGNE